jgi:hypothetical protein
VAYLRDLIVFGFPQYGILRLGLFLSLGIKIPSEIPSGIDGTQASAVTGKQLTA